MCGAGQDLGHQRGEGQMPCGEHNGISEAGGVENPFIEDDDTRRERDPGRDVEGGVESGLGRLARLCFGVDSGQDVCRPLLLARLPFLLGHCDDV